MKVEQNLRKDFWNWKDFTSKNSLVCIKETRNKKQSKRKDYEEKSNIIDIVNYNEHLQRIKCTNT